MEYTVTTGKDLIYADYHSIYKDCFKEGFISENEFNTYDRDNFRLIYDNGGLIAMMYFEERENASIHLSKLCVRGPFRRRGLGRVLVEEAKKYAKDHKINRITLSVQSLNDPALSLYEKLGFSVYNRRYRFFVSKKEINEKPYCDVKIVKKNSLYLFDVEFYNKDQFIGSGVVNTEMGGCKDFELTMPKQDIEMVLSGLKPFLKPNTDGLYLMTENWLVVNECLMLGFYAEAVIVGMECSDF